MRCSRWRESIEICKPLTARDVDRKTGESHAHEPGELADPLMMVYDASGDSAEASFPRSACWAGMDGNCENSSRGDPIVFYDDGADTPRSSRDRISAGVAMKLTPSEVEI